MKDLERELDVAQARDCAAASNDSEDAEHESADAGAEQNVRGLARLPAVSLVALDGGQQCGADVLALLALLRLGETGGLVLVLLVVLLRILVGDVGRADLLAVLLVALLAVLRGAALVVLGASVGVVLARAFASSA